MQIAVFAFVLFTLSDLINDAFQKQLSFFEVRKESVFVPSLESFNGWNGLTHHVAFE